MNKLFQGDNLSIMRDLPDASIDLICTDPPFNTGKDWGAFDDRWQSLDKYLKFMEARVVECRRVLKDTGSLYLHCDPTASHYLKVMLDSVFGIKQFRNEIVWKRMNGGKNNLTSKYDAVTDRILFYVKTGEYVFNHPYQPFTQEHIHNTYTYNDNDGKGKYKWDKLHHGKCKEKKKYYLSNAKGISTKDIWVDIKPVGAVDSNRTGYPTQKPVALYARMIRASSNQHDVVLDPFAGSGTTLDAAQSLGRAWIGIDVGDDAIDVGDDAINVIQRRMKARHGMLLEYELIP